MSAAAETPIAVPPLQGPFHFNSASHLLRVCRERARNLPELLAALHTCEDAAIFQHTFRTLQEHHFIQQGFSNDFAHWTHTQCGEAGLGEKLAALDVREFTSIDELRRRIEQIVGRYLEENPEAGERRARQAFYFCASDTVLIPTSFVAHDRAEFVDALQKVTIHAIQYHFIEARLRLKLRSNDFSMWLKEYLGLPAMATAIERIDIYTSTLEDVRRRIVHIAGGASASDKEI